MSNNCNVDPRPDPRNRDRRYFGESLHTLYSLPGGGDGIKYIFDKLYSTNEAISNAITVPHLADTRRPMDMTNSLLNTPYEEDDEDEDKKTYIDLWIRDLRRLRFMRGRRVSHDQFVAVFWRVQDSLKNLRDVREHLEYWTSRYVQNIVDDILENVKKATDELDAYLEGIGWVTDSGFTHR